MSIAEDLNEAMLPWLTPDLEDYNNAIGWMFHTVEQWFDEDDEDGNWAMLLDPDLCPVEALPYLAQYVGERLPTGISEPLAREWIKDAPNQLRGTAYSIFRAAQRTLIGSRTVQIIERSAAARPNQVANPSFETDTSGWSSTTGYYLTTAPTSMTRVTTQAEVGAASLQVVTTATGGGQGAKYLIPIALAAGQQYDFTVFLKANANMQLGLFIGNGASDPGVNQTTGGVAVTTAWQQFTVSYTPTVDVPANTALLGVKTLAAGAAGTFFVDNVQLQLHDDPDRISVYTYTAETPNPAQVLADLLTVVPADIVLDYEVRTGQSWADVATTYASWTSEASSNVTWDQLAGQTAGTNTYSRPQPL
jgi:hypothetical protein